MKSLDIRSCYSKVDMLNSFTGINAWAPINAWASIVRVFIVVANGSPFHDPFSTNHVGRPWASVVDLKEVVWDEGDN